MRDRVMRYVPGVLMMRAGARDICEFAMSLFRREIRMMAEHTVECKASIRLRIGGDGPHSRVMCRALSSCIVFPRVMCCAPVRPPPGTAPPSSGTTSLSEEPPPPSSGTPVHYGVK